MTCSLLQCNHFDHTDLCTWSIYKKTTRILRVISLTNYHLALAIEPSNNTAVKQGERLIMKKEQNGKADPIEAQKQWRPKIKTNQAKGESEPNLQQRKTGKKISEEKVLERRQKASVPQKQ